MNYKELKTEVDQVRSSVNKLLNIFTERALNDLRIRRYSKVVDIFDFNKRDNPNIQTSSDFFSIFREEVGVYLFEANFEDYYERWFEKISFRNLEELKKIWFEEIERLWSGIDKSPAFYKRRAGYHFVNEQTNKFQGGWVPLYVGKSKNIQSRVYEHIEGLSPKTYGMKLRHREKLKKSGIKFRVSYSPLDELDDEILYELVKVVENKIRAKYNPIIGKQ